MQHRPRRIREELLLHGWWLVPLVVCVWFRQLQLPSEDPGPALDQSWHAVKGWELLTNVRLGIDSVFTYGRLGWFHDAPGQAQLFAWKFWGFEIALKLALCALCAWAVLRTSGGLARLCFSLALLCVAGGLDALAFVALLALFAQLLASPGRRARGELGWLVVAALLAQVKFTYFLFWGAGIALVFAALWADVSLRRALAFLLRASGAFLFLWIAFGQSPADIPAWLRTSCWITSGYNEAMSAAGPARELWLALGMLAALGGVLALELGMSERGVRPRAQLLLVLAAVLLAWRTSFTRQIGNSDVFFSVAPAAAWCVLRARAEGSRVRANAALLLRAALLVAGAWGLANSHPQPGATLGRILAQRASSAAQTLRDLAHPPELRERNRRRGAEIAAQWDLPRVRRRVGDRTLDVFRYSQAIAFLNGFQFHPRPVFQSYSAFTPELLELNRAFYADERAPAFALYRIEPIDGRLAPTEDAKAFDELLLCYRPCLQEHGWLLLERESGPARAHSDAELETRSYALEQWIELERLPGEALELRLDPRPSLRGRLESLLLRGPRLECEVERADGSHARARIAPGAARAGFLVRPFVETRADLAQVFTGRPLAGLRRLRLLAPQGANAPWQERFEATVLRRSGLLPPPREQLALALEYSDFDPPPSEVSGADGVQAALHVFAAPAELRWALQPGSYRLTGGYGLLETAGQEPRQGSGALVFVVLQHGREETQLLRRPLDPSAVPADRGRQALQLEFELREASDLYLRMRADGSADAARERIFWDGVKIENR